jgi:uncharacterized protein
MTTRVVESNPHVAENTGKISFQRGPLVYCAESIDNNETLPGIESQHLGKVVQEKWDPELGGFVRLKIENSSGTINLLPYYLWSNRGETSMKVWL